MIKDKKVFIVLPAFNAEKTLLKTYEEIPREFVDGILLVDDHSNDRTVEIARKLDIEVIVHEQNLGYGGNQKTCYTEAVKRGADIIIMLHPDYQYPPKLIEPMAALIASGMFDVVLGSRILGGFALKGNMPLYKFIANRILTFCQNLVTGQKLSEYHTGYRAFSREVLLNLPLLENSNNFVFDGQILHQAAQFGYRIGEISSPCAYTKDSSSTSFTASILYGCGVMATVFQHALHKSGLAKSPIFNPDGRKIQ